VETGEERGREMQGGRVRNDEGGWGESRGRGGGRGGGRVKIGK